MIRRAAFLLPWHHHHAPYVLDRVLKSKPQLDALVVTTPKLATGKRTTLDGVRATRSISGPVYLGVMGLMSVGVAAAARAEKLRGRPRPGWKYLSMKQVLAEHPKARHLPVKGVNDPGTLDALRAFAPEAVVAVFFNQILGRELRALAPAWNLHPSLLPSFRGVSPVFWMLEQGVETAGVTLHGITDEIDQGPFLGQDSFRVEDVDSYFSLYRKCAERGAGLIVKAMGDPAARVSPDPAVPPSHFSHPSAAAVRRFHRRGRKFFRAW